MRPLLSSDVFSGPGMPWVPGAAHVKFTVDARSALALALLHAGIGAGDSVLVPAYHCPAMVAPLAWLGVQAQFYPIRADTSLDLAALFALLQPATRAVLAVHFFGFLQDFRPLRAWCDARGLLLIEDCAHALFGQLHGQAVGLQGHYAIASIMKFLPVDEGGCLVSSSRALDAIALHSGGWFFQLKSLLNTLEMACEHGRLPGLALVLAQKKRWWQRFKVARGRTAAAADAVAADAAPDDDAIFDPARLRLRMSWSSQAILRGMAMARACARRRANYLALLDGLGGLAGASALFGALPDGVYPHVFPLLLNDPDSVVLALKLRGLPFLRFGHFRWRGAEGALCPTAEALSRRLIQLPCHQSLSGQELACLIASVRAVIGQP